MSSKSRAACKGTVGVEVGDLLEPAACQKSHRLTTTDRKSKKNKMGTFLSDKVLIYATIGQ